MAKLLKIVQDNKAEKILRFINYVVDYVISLVVIILLFGLSAIAYSLISGEDIYITLERFETMDPIVDRLVTFVLYAILMIIVEIVTKGRSLGKYITGTMVVKSDNSTLTTRDIFIRNSSRLIPFDILSFIGQNGWHDSLTNTRVVKKKAFDNAINQKLDLETLGLSNNDYSQQIGVQKSFESN